MPSFILNDKFVTKSSKDRLYRLDNAIIGLTGGIATGKSTASEILLKLGHLVIDADKLVKRIYNSDESVAFITAIAPHCVDNDKINFRSLRELFFREKKLKEQIEKYIYPKLREEFLKEVPNKNTKVIFYDAPILFERSLDKLVDQTLLIYAPKEIQIQRLTQRDSIDEQLAEKILASQLSIEEKKNKADFVIENTRDIKYLERALRDLIAQITI